MTKDWFSGVAVILIKPSPVGIASICNPIRLMVSPVYDPILSTTISLFTLSNTSRIFEFKRFLIIQFLFWKVNAVDVIILFTSSAVAIDCGSLKV